MKIYPRACVSQLSELPVFKVIESQQPDFNTMTKEELINFIPSEASIGWTKPKILEEINKTYNHAKQYFAKHAEGLSRLKSGQLCLMGKKPDIFISDQPVYLLTGLYWFHYVDKAGCRDSCVSCELQELRITTFFSRREDRLHCYDPSGFYGDNQVIYPLPLKYLKLEPKAIENFKEALKLLKPPVLRSL